MKYTGGKSWFDKSTQEWKHNPRVYTNFYCSLKEWSNLGRGKHHFMYQLRERIAEKIFFKYESEKQYYCNKEGNVESYKLSFDRTGRRDGLYTEEYSAEIIKETIKLITNREAQVDFYSWKGTIDHIEVSFPDVKSMPNIICLIDEYSGSSTNRTLIFVIDCIYKVLGWKTIEWYDRYLEKFYNKDYDFVFLNPNNERDIYQEWEDKTMWKDMIMKTSNRIYNCTKISYK